MNVELDWNPIGTADVVGQRIKGIGRITGLNPSGPNFDQIPPDQRLDRSDALFVG